MGVTPKVPMTNTLDGFESLAEAEARRKAEAEALDREARAIAAFKAEGDKPAPLGPPTNAFGVPEPGAK